MQSIYLLPFEDIRLWIQVHIHFQTRLNESSEVLIGWYCIMELVQLDCFFDKSRLHG